MKNPKKYKRDGIQGLDIVLIIILVIGALMVIIPVFNVFAVSFTTEKEYLTSQWITWPKNPTLSQYQVVFGAARLGIGYKTTLVYIALGVPINLILNSMLAYALSCKGWPGKRLVLAFVMITMIFNGGTVPLYLTLKGYHLTDSIFGVILSQGMNTFNMILIYNYFNTLPASLVESARLDGASELRILIRIILPLAKPILATVTLFTMVQFWNEYFMSMILLKDKNWRSLQQILRSIVVDTDLKTNSQSIAAGAQREAFGDGLKNAAVVCTMVPIMCVYPFLQKYFVKGVTIGAVKA